MTPELLAQATALLDLARKEAHVLATAESCTGGLIAATLTAIPGSSSVFDRSFVTYSNDAKRRMLGVQQSTLTKHGAVSEQVAHEMAAQTFAQSNASIAVSVTGLAGPGGSDHKPEGRVCFGLAWENGLITETVEFGAIGRQAVRDATVGEAFRLMSRCIETETHEKYANQRGNAENLGN